MDDANLSSLQIISKSNAKESSLELTPAFHTDIVSYAITVASNIDTLRLKPVTNDRGASFTIKSPSGYGEDVQLQIGVNKLLIEVSSEDGTIKKYTVECNLLSESDADLKLMRFEDASININPLFETNICEYETSVGFSLADTSIKLELFDPCCSIDVFMNDIKLNGLENGIYQLSLNYSFSEIKVQVTSPNKSTTKVYFIYFFLMVWFGHFDKQLN